MELIQNWDELGTQGMAARVVSLEAQEDVGEVLAGDVLEIEEHSVVVRDDVVHLRTCKISFEPRRFIRAYCYDGKGGQRRRQPDAACEGIRAREALQYAPPELEC